MAEFDAEDFQSRLRAAFQPAMDRLAQTIKDAHRVIEEAFGGPEGLASALEAARPRRSELCHCWCGLRGHGSGICVTVATTSLTFRSESLGPTEVPMCQPCANHRAVIR